MLSMQHVNCAHMQMLKCFSSKIRELLREIEEFADIDHHGLPKHCLTGSWNVFSSSIQRSANFTSQDDEKPGRMKRGVDRFKVSAVHSPCVDGDKQTFFK